jgi:hypothetical protein
MFTSMGSPDCVCIARVGKQYQDRYDLLFILNKTWNWLWFNDAVDMLTLCDEVRHLVCVAVWIRMERSKSRNDEIVIVPTLEGIDAVGARDSGNGLDC